MKQKMKNGNETKNRNGKNLRWSLICLLILILGKEILLCKKSVTENTRNVCT